MSQNFFAENDDQQVPDNDIIVDESSVEKVTYKSKRDEIEQTWLIGCLAIGISEDEFWSLNPHKVKLRVKAHKKQQEERDYEMWMQGMYNMYAFGVVLANAFGSKKEYLKEPITVSNRELSEAEKIEKTKEFFKGLEIMQKNFELSSDK